MAIKVTRSTVEAASVTVPGFEGDIKVDMDVDTTSGAVSNVSVIGSGIEDEEKAERSQAVFDHMSAAMNESGSIDVDVVSGATVSSMAVLEAARHAVAQACGRDSSDAKMAPGTYRASAYGFYPGLPVNVSVQVSEDRIDGIEIEGENLEVVEMLRAADELYIPRIIEHQALCVDAVSCATQTCSAVRLATTRCLEDAYAAAGNDVDAIFPWLRRPEYPKTDPIRLEKDVVVIGLGGGGIMTSLSAAESGLDVLAIDTAGKYGGTTCVTSESFGVNPVKHKQANNGGADYCDGQAMFEDWLARCHGDAKEEILDLYFKESGNTIDWLNFQHDFPYNKPVPGHVDYAVFDCTFEYSPYTLSGRKAELAELLDRLMGQYVELGGQYMLEVNATKLLQDEAGRVIGIEAVRYDGQVYEISAKAVVLATGGFGGNAKLMKRFMIDDYYPLAGNWHMYGMDSKDGRVLEQALEMGAAVKNASIPPLSHCAGFPTNITGFGTHETDDINFFTGIRTIWSEGDIPQSLCVAADALATNLHGERFFNEEEFAEHGAVKGGPEYYTIWSQEQFDRYRDNGFTYSDPGPSMGFLACQSALPTDTPLPQFDEVIKAGIRTGYIFKADTLEELAEKIGVEPATLVATVERYDAFCDAGSDDDFGKKPEYLVKVGEGPYFAILGCAFYYTTGGLLDVDRDLEVLREDGSVIEGLYAVGTDCMGTLMTNREQYLDYGGAASGWAFTSGRLVGKAIAAKLGK